jgi:hypothetical protein
VNLKGPILIRDLKWRWTIRPDAARHIVSLAVILVILIAAYHRLFSGATFLTDDDPVALWAHGYGNAVGNGWRPDKGLGLSFFFGDPGAFHPWSLWSLWERLFTTPYRAFDISILLLLWAAALAQYVFLLRIVPRLQPTVAAVLATLVVLGPLQSEFFFQRHWITLSIGTPLILMLLERHFSAAKGANYVLFAVLVFGTLFLGSVASLEQLLFVGAAFTFCYSAYYRQLAPFRHFLGLAIVGGVVAAILGAWTLYPIALEMNLGEYVRDPQYVGSEMVWRLDPLGLVGFTKSLFLVSWFPNVPFAFPPWFAPTLSWTNVSIIFPLILVVVLFLRPSGFWHWTLARLLIGFLVHELLFEVVAPYQQLWGKLINLYPLGKFQPAYHIFEIGLLALLLERCVEAKEPTLSKIGSRCYAFIGSSLLTFYTLVGTTVVIIAAFGPSIETTFKSALDKILPNTIARYTKPFLLETLGFNFQLVSEVSWRLALCFFVSGVVLLAVMLRSSCRRVLVGTNGLPASLLLVVNGLCLSWFVLPLNESGTVWQQADPVLPKMPTFAETDRFYRFTDPTQLDQSTAEKFRKGMAGEFGAVRTQFGYLQTPALNLSGLKPYTQQPIATYISTAFTGSPERLSSMRGLTEGPLHVSPLLNLAAVSHYYTHREMIVPKSLVLIFKTRQLYIYRNTAAWPYMYLARRTEDIGSALPILPSPGTAYLPQGAVTIDEPSKDATLHITNFNYGEIHARYVNSRKGFLVVADAWHPFWRASVDGNDVPIIRTNGVFKGIATPEGEHNVRFWFDTSPYKPGIYVSVCAWVSLIGAYFWGKRTRTDPIELRKQSP